IEFFRAYYIQRSQSAPVPAQEPRPDAGATEVAEEVNIPVEKTYSGPYSTDIEKPHYFVFVIPAQGVDKPAFVKGLELFNEAGEGAGLSIREVPVDEVRNAVVVTGLPDKEAALRYSKMVLQNRDLYAPLGN